MKKYKVKNTAIMHNGTIAYEGNIIELSDEQAKRLEDYVELVPESKKQETKSNKNSNKTTETKTDDTSKTTEEISSLVTDGGNDGK